MRDDIGTQIIDWIFIIILFIFILLMIRQDYQFKQIQEKQRLQIEASKDIKNYQLPVNVFEEFK